MSVSIFAGDFDQDGKTCVAPTKYKRIKNFYKELDMGCFSVECFFCALNYSEEEHFRSA